MNKITGQPPISDTKMLYILYYPGEENISKNISFSLFYPYFLLYGI